MERICGVLDRAWSGMNDRLFLLPKITMTALVGVPKSVASPYSIMGARCHIDWS
jgi:hypothetical protein